MRGGNVEGNAALPQVRGVQRDKATRVRQTGDRHIHDFAVLQGPPAYRLLSCVGITLDHAGLAPDRQRRQPRGRLVSAHKAGNMAHRLPHRRALGLELFPDSGAEAVFGRMMATPCGRETLSHTQSPRGSLLILYLPLAPRIATASISTRSSGAARALTSTRVETGKSPVKNSLRALHTSSRCRILVTKILTLTTSSMQPPAASMRCLILVSVAFACSYMLSPPGMSFPVRAVIPATKT